MTVPVVELTIMMSGCGAMYEMFFDAMTRSAPADEVWTMEVNEVPAGELFLFEHYNR